MKATAAKTKQNKCTAYVAINPYFPPVPQDLFISKFSVNYLNFVNQQPYRLNPDKFVK